MTDTHSPDTEHRSGWRTIRKVAPYLWPDDEPWVKRRVMLAMVALLVSKIVAVANPFFYKAAVDTLSGETMDAAWALGLGAVAAYAVQRLMDYLRGSQSGALPGAAALAGAEARVVVGLAGTRAGKVDVVAGDRTYQFVARLHEGAGVDHVEVGDSVVVVRIQDGIALVAEKSYLV